jgi:MFS family permease
VSPLHSAAPAVDSAYSWLRLAVSVLLATIGGVGMWSATVALPEMAAEFGVGAGDASLPYAATMLGFGLGGIVIGRLADRIGVMWPAVASAIGLGLGYVAVGRSATLWQVVLAQGVLIGFGSAATFGPLIADVSHWFECRRGIAIALCASGNYIAGAVWPLIIHHFIARDGWRATHIGIGLFCLVTMLPLVLMLRRQPVKAAVAVSAFGSGSSRGDIGLAPNALHLWLSVAGVGCCMAMAMPQAHIVRYCVALGYGDGPGSAMLALMMAFGFASRVASGVIADAIGGLRNLLLGSALQAVALLLYLLFDGRNSLFVVSALFGLFQGGIVPSYAVIVREYFPPGEAAGRLGVILMATLVGMAGGGWISGVIFDATGTYRDAFAHGLAWNILNAGVVAWLLLRRRTQLAPA